MSHKPHAFENQIFEHYRERAKEINKAIELLKEHGYTVIDLQNNILRKNKIEDNEL